jgi:hypothetical protein
MLVIEAFDKVPGELPFPMLCGRRCEHAEQNIQAQAATDLRAWLSWARRCRLEPFKKLARTLKERFNAVVRGMVDHGSNTFVEAMNGLLQPPMATQIPPPVATSNSPT